MQNDITIEYSLVGAGWAQCYLDVYGAVCTTTASYLSDALFELVNGTNHMLGGGNEARFSFDDEPGEYRWIFRRTSIGGLGIKILEFDDLWGGKPDEDGAVLADFMCQARDFGAALLVSLNKLLDEIGVAGYRETWSSTEFPIADYKILCAHLGEPLSPRLRTTDAQ